MHLLDMPNSILNFAALSSQVDPCANGIEAAPGTVPFSARKQTLTVDTALTADISDSELEVLISGYVEVGLTLETR